MARVHIGRWILLGLGSLTVLAAAYLYLGLQNIPVRPLEGATGILLVAAAVFLTGFLVTLGPAGPAAAANKAYGTCPCGCWHCGKGTCACGHACCSDESGLPTDPAAPGPGQGH